MLRPLVLFLTLSLLTPLAAAAQTPDTPTPPVDPQIELNLISLPTTQSVKRHRGYFRLNHRFARDLRLGDFSDLAADLFALDNGAVLGLEYRFGLTSALQAGVHRSTLTKTLQAFSRWDAVRQGERFPIGASAFASIEGFDNLQEARQPAYGAVLSRTWGRTLAIYASPTYVDRTNHAALTAAGLSGHHHDGEPSLTPPAVVVAEDDWTFYVGLGARARLRPSVFVTAEYSPRQTGYAEGPPAWGAAIEKVTYGHTLALTVTNSYATTPGQIARGGTSDALYLGFNITRKF
jgi:hypothetical protein